MKPNFLLHKTVLSSQDCKSQNLFICLKTVEVGDWVSDPCPDPPRQWGVIGLQGEANYLGPPATVAAHLSESTEETA